MDNAESVRLTASPYHWLLLAVLGMVSPAFAGGPPDVRKLEMTVTAKPKDELLEVEVALHLAACGGRSSFFFLKPKALQRVYDVRTGKNLAYAITPLAAKRGLYALEVSLGPGKMPRVLGMKYRYDRQAFFGSAINPATNDDLIYGQITKESIYASHLYYYPSTDVTAPEAVIRIVTP